MFKSSIVFATFYCSKLLKRTQREAGLARQSCAGDPRATRRAGALVRRGAAHAVGGEVAIVTRRGRLMQQGPKTLRASPPRFPGGRGAPPEPARWGASRAPRDREVEWRPPSPAGSLSLGVMSGGPKPSRGARVFRGAPEEASSSASVHALLRGNGDPDASGCVTQRGSVRSRAAPAHLRGTGAASHPPWPRRSSLPAPPHGPGQWPALTCGPVCPLLHHVLICD